MKNIFPYARFPVGSSKAELSLPASVYLPTQRALTVGWRERLPYVVKAKGFADCVAFLQNGECTVVVQTSESNQSNAIVIKDIVAGQSGVSYDRIKIVECA